MSTEERIRDMVYWALHGAPSELPLDERVTRVIMQAMTVHVCDICQQEASRPDLRGTMWCERKWAGKGIWMSFSSSLVGHAGGLDAMLRDWEIVEDNRSEAQKAMKP